MREEATHSTPLALKQGAGRRAVFDARPVWASGAALAGAALAGAAWAALGLVTFWLPAQGPEALGSPAFYLVEAVSGVAATGTLLGLLGLHARREAAEEYGWPGTWGLSMVLVGAALLLGACAADVAAGREVLEGLAGLWAISAMLVGFVLLGVGVVMRAGLLPRWSGAVLVVGPPVSVALGNHSGEIALGLVWLALGYVLWSGRDEKRPGGPFARDELPGI